MKKGKVLTTISMLVMTIACLTFGVFALVSTTFTASGTITFNAYNLDADIQVDIYGTTDGTAVDTSNSSETYKIAGLKKKTIYASTKTNTDYHRLSRSKYQNTIVSATTPLPLGDMEFDGLNTEISEENSEWLKKIVIVAKYTNYSGYDTQMSVTTLPAISNLTIENTKAVIAQKYENSTATTSGLLIVTILAGETSVAKTNFNLGITIEPFDIIKYYTDQGYTIAQLSDFTTSGTSLKGYKASATKLYITKFDNIDTIGSMAFYEKTTLTDVVIANGYSAIGNSAFNGCSSLTSITIPEGVTSIGDYAFSGCSSLTSITIPNGVTSIGMFVFDTKLSSITIPSSVTSIGYGTLDGLSDSAYTTIGNAKYLTDGTNPTVLCKAINTTITSCEIAPTTKIIHCSAFQSCGNLTSVTIPSCVTYIGANSFLNCSSLTSIILPENITLIDDGAFIGCANLTSIDCRSAQLSAETLGYEIVVDSDSNEPLAFNFKKDGSTTSTSVTKWQQGPGVYTR